MLVFLPDQLGACELIPRRFLLQFFIRDSKSSSGTFLNHIRLSNPNQESRPFSIKDGDVIQLGVDYQGGTEEMYRCVKMKVEVGRERQRGQQNNFK